MSSVMKGYYEYRGQTCRRDLSQFVTQSRASYHQLQLLKGEFEIVVRAMQQFLEEHTSTQVKRCQPAQQGEDERKGASVSRRRKRNQEPDPVEVARASCPHEQTRTSHSRGLHGRTAQLVKTIDKSSCSKTASSGDQESKPPTSSNDFSHPVPCY